MGTASSLGSCTAGPGVGAAAGALLSTIGNANTAQARAGVGVRLVK
ncbi:hypothetical protein [Microbispora sp. H10830]|nr:hypothetical protein [Microbispora sp. H10830]